jgi:GWxTD domain-containing protein
VLLLAVGLFVSSAPTASSDERVERLPTHHRKWLEEEVGYIITDVERERFLDIAAADVRDAFIDAFWRKRDENPATQENEYRDEHYKRLAYANEFLGRDTFRPGFQTDRGRYHILLGPPSEKQDFEVYDALYPAELWFYNKPELKSYGLPPFFYLLFFRRHGGGEMKLYSPLGDGPQALLTGYQTRSMDFRSDVERAYNTLYQISPELAQASISFRTDEGDIVQFQSPSFGSISLLDTIVAAPLKGVDTSYAENFDVEKGLVESDYLFSYVPSSGAAHVLPGPSGHAFAHWTIEIDSKHLALVKDEERGLLATQFIVSAQVSQRAEPFMTVVDSRKESFMSFQESEIQAVLKSPFAYSGIIPLVPGSYDLRVVLRNRACSSREESSCRKSYTLLDAPVEVPAESVEPRLSDLVLAYGVEQRPRTGRAYEFERGQLLPNPIGVFAVSERAVAAVAARNAEPGMTVSFLIADRESGSPVSQGNALPGELASTPVVQEFSLEDVASGFYRLEARLVAQDGAVLDKRAVDFDVTPRNTVPRPGIRGYWAEAAADVPGMVEAALASQHMGLGGREEARSLFEEAIEKNPRLGVPREALAYLAVEDGNFDRVIELLQPVYAQIQDRFEVLALLGEAYVKKKDYARGAELLEKALSLRRLQPSLLNLLAVCHHHLGDRERALELLSLSLTEDPNQPAIRQLMDELERESSAANPKM